MAMSKSQKHNFLPCLALAGGRGIDGQRDYSSPGLIYRILGYSVHGTSSMVHSMAAVFPILNNCTESMSSSVS